MAPSLRATKAAAAVVVDDDDSSATPKKKRKASSVKKTTPVEKASPKKAKKATKAKAKAKTADSAASTPAKKAKKATKAKKESPESPSPKKKAAPKHQVLTERDEIPKLWDSEKAKKNGSYSKYDCARSRYREMSLLLCPCRQQSSHTTTPPYHTACLYSLQDCFVERGWTPRFDAQSPKRSC